MGKKKIPLLGPELRNIQPKLRMIANGIQDVNEVRSAFSSSIRVVLQNKDFKRIVSAFHTSEAGGHDNTNF